VDVPTIDGKTISAKIPPLTENGTQFRFKGHGMPIYGGSGRGNMIGVVKLIMPEKLDDEDKKVLEELCEKDNFK
jgi:DnaJ-class molecular chaperone